MALIYVDNIPIDLNNRDGAPNFLLSASALNDQMIAMYLGGALGGGSRITGTLRRWIGTSNTSGGTGIATFFPTEDNTAGGIALFTQIFAVTASALATSGSAIDVPVCAPRSIAGDLRTVTIIGATGVGLGLGVLASMELVPAGTTITAVIDGIGP